MIVDSDNDLEGQITEWRAYMRRHRELLHTDTEELEDHLRSRITDLTEAGLRADEAFLIAVNAWAASMSCRGSSLASIPSGCGNSSCCPGSRMRPPPPAPVASCCHGALCDRRGARDQGAGLVRA